MRTLAPLAVLALLAGPAAAADAPSASPEGTASIPACDDPAVLGDIVERQHWAEANTWKNGLRIEGIGAIRQVYGTTTFVSAIDHRHCVARADLGPGRSDRLYYVIFEEMGFAGISWKVEFCMPGFDPYRVYDAACRVLR